MLDCVKNAWADYSDNLNNLTGFYTYKDLFAVAVEKVLNPYLDENNNALDDDYYLFDGLDIENITEIDNGNYQGTIIFIIPYKGGSPDISQYLCTYVEYGSCSACDSLEAAYSLKGKEKQKALKQICLNLLQNLDFLRRS